MAVNDETETAAPTGRFTREGATPQPAQGTPRSTVSPTPADPAVPPPPSGGAIPPPPTAPPHRAPVSPSRGAAPPPPRPPSPWPGRFQRAATAVFGFVYRALCRPRVRLTVLGAILLLIGAFVATDSVWTLPLIVLGVGMLLVAWIGSRLDGRFAVEWGETGTQLEFRAQIKAPPQPARPAIAGPAPEAPAPVAAPKPDVIEGEAHTIEIDVAELKALIAAAEAEDAASRPAAA